MSETKVIEVTARWHSDPPGMERVVFDHLLAQYDTFLFDDCQKKFRRLATVRQSALDSPRVEPTDPDEVFIAEFLAIAKRTLSADDQRLFRLLYVLGTELEFICDRSGVSRYDAYQAQQRIQMELGGAFRSAGLRGR